MANPTVSASEILLDSEFGQEIARGDRFLLIAWLVIRIAEGHGDVHDQLQTRLVGESAHILERVQCLFRALLLVAAKEFGGKRIRKAKGAHRVCLNRPLRPLLVYHDGDNFDVVRRIEELQHQLRIGHLRDDGRRNEGYCVNLLEPGADQRAQVFGLDLGGDLLRKALPSITRALDNFHRICHIPRLGLWPRENPRSQNRDLSHPPCTYCWYLLLA